MDRLNAGPVADSGRVSQRTAWLLFGPPAFMVGVRWILQLFEDRQGGLPALPLVPVSTTDSPLALLWPVALALAVLLAAGLVIHRLGWRRVMPALGVLWLLLWLGGSAALAQRHLNRQGLFLREMTASAPAPQPQLVKARVISSQFKPASLRSLGGTELVLQVSSLEIPQRVLIGDPAAATLKPGDTLALQLSPGRFDGRFVTGWQAAPSASP